MKKQNDVMVMKNELINAKYDLKSLEELKIFAYAVSTIRKDINKFKVVKINIKDFMELTGSKNKYSRIKNLGNSLARTIFQVQDNPKSWTQYTMFSYVRYEDKEGILSLKFNKDIKPYLLNITKNEQYTLSNFKNLAHLSSNYAHRIYLMLKQYQNTDHKTRNFNIAELQEILKCPASYQTNYKIFRQKVLNISIKEINNKTDLEIIDIETFKTGRKITEIKFHFKMKKELNKNKLNISSYKNFVSSLRENREGQEVLSPRAENIKTIEGNIYLKETRIFMEKGLLKSNADKSLLTKDESEYLYKQMFVLEKEKIV